jgi:hypothetical protein
MMNDELGTIGVVLQIASSNFLVIIYQLASIAKIDRYLYSSTFAARSCYYSEGV